MRHTRRAVLGRERAGTLLDLLVHPRDALPVLAQVLLPGGHDVGLHEALRIGAVLVEVPALRSRASPRATHPDHLLPERVAVLLRHAVLHLDEHGPVAGRGLDDEVRLGPVLGGTHVDRAARPQPVAPPAPSPASIPPVTIVSATRRPDFSAP